MSLARKCDKCGNYYTPENHKIILTDDEILDFIRRAAQSCPELSQQLMSIGLELLRRNRSVEVEE